MTNKKPAKRVVKRPSVKQLQQKVVELEEDLLRSQAEFINYRRRSEEEQARAAETGKEFVLTVLLPVIDNIERALVNVPEDLTDHKYVSGVQSVAKQLHDALVNLGVTKIATVGEEFDPEKMEAVSMDGGDGEREVITHELQAGYELNGHVIRHAMVKVGRKK